MRTLVGLLVYVIVELVIAIAVASVIGWFAVIILIIAAFAVGLVVMKNAGMASVRAMQTASRSGQTPDGEVGDSALLFVAGLLIAVPGFLTDVLGGLLTIPPLRRAVRRWSSGFITRRLSARGLSVVTTTVDGNRVTRVVPGDVVAGDVIRRTDDDPNGQSDPQPRRIIEPDNIIDPPN